MEVVLATNEPVRLSFVLMLLREAGCQPITLDGYMAVAEGSAGAIQRRIAVPASSTHSPARPARGWRIVADRVNIPVCARSMR